MGIMRSNAGGGGAAGLREAALQAYEGCLLNQSLIGCSSETDGALYIGRPAEIAYTASANFTLPDEITVKMNGLVLTEGSGYVWRQETGSLEIPDVTGEVEVEINAELSGGLYTACNYIQSSGTQYISTGVTGTGNTSAELVFARLTSYPAGWWGVIGACAYNINRSLLFGLYGSGNTGTFQFGTVNYADISFSLAAETPCKVYINKNKLYLNEVLKATLESSTYTTPVPLALFWQAYSSSTSMAKAQMRLYYCKIYEGTSLLRYFIPCVRNSDNKPGLYDAVNGGFYENAGSGEFSYA
jgi:hypothetical protein